MVAPTIRSPLHQSPLIVLTQQKNSLKHAFLIIPDLPSSLYK
jgi:hypothetical protein